MSRFTALLFIMYRGTVEASFRNCRKQAAPGVDGCDMAGV